MVNQNTAVYHIQTMDSERFNRSKSAVKFYIYNGTPFLRKNLATKYKITEQDVQALFAIVGSVRTGVSSHHNYNWSIQGEMSQTERWINFYFKNLTKKKVITGEFTNLDKFLWDKQQVIKNKQLDILQSERMQSIGKERKLKEDRYQQVKKNKQLKTKVFEAKLRQSDTELGIGRNSKIKFGRLAWFIILLILGTIFLMVRNSAEQPDISSLIVYISLLTAAFSIYNQLRPKKYSTFVNTLFFFIGLFIMNYSVFFFVLITLTVFQRPLLKLVRNINLRDN